jgi:hypothetical protein
MNLKTKYYGKRFFFLWERPSCQSEGFFFTVEFGHFLGTMLFIKLFFSFFRKKIVFVFFSAKNISFLLKTKFRLLFELKDTNKMLVEIEEH